MKYKLYVYLLLPIFIYSCGDEPLRQMPVDNHSPGQVKDVKVTNIPGGAYFTYTLPEDNDLLYIKAVYQLKDGGEILNTKASIYSDTLWVHGYGDTQEKSVQLISVDRSNNESEPVSVSINPETPPVYTIFESLSLVEDFGGIRYKFENESSANICLNILKKDESGDFVQIDQLYTKRKSGNVKMTGMESKEEVFGIYVTDRWENKSDTLIETLTPLYEVQVPFRDIKPYNMAGDTPSSHGWVVEQLWNGVTTDISNAGYHTSVDNGPWPHRVTFKIMPGALKCSRLKLFHRDGDWLYKHGNIKKFELWGSNDPNPDGSDDGWTKLGDYESYKPSGLPGSEKTNEDIEYASQGENFDIPIEYEPYQYFRVKFTETWSGSKFVHLLEIEMYGDPQWDFVEPEKE